MFVCLVWDHDDSLFIVLPFFFRPILLYLDIEWISEGFKLHYYTPKEMAVILQYMIRFLNILVNLCFLSSIESTSTKKKITLSFLAKNSKLFTIWLKVHQDSKALRSTPPCPCSTTTWWTTETRSTSAANTGAEAPSWAAAPAGREITPCPASPPTRTDRPTTPWLGSGSPWEATVTWVLTGGLPLTLHPLLTTPLCPTRCSWVLRFRETFTIHQTRRAQVRR